MAAPMSEKFKPISSLKRRDGLVLLREHLGWPAFDNEDHPRCSIHLDCLYDNLLFMIQKGFQWNEIAVLFCLIKEILENCGDSSLHDMIHMYRNKVEEAAPCCSRQTLTNFSDYFFSTLMRHFKLYQYVFSRHQSKLVTDVQLDVNTPQSPLPFTQATEQRIYEYQKRYEMLEQKQEIRSEKHQQQYQLIEEEKEEKLSKILEPVENAEGAMQREEITKLIHEVASAQISSVSDYIKCQVASTMDNIDIMFEKTALPRPEELGPPPRYTVHTPLTPHSKSKSSKHNLKSRDSSTKSLKSRNK